MQNEKLIVTLKTLTKTVLPNNLVSKIQSSLHILSIVRMRGFDLHINFPDRDILEDIIIPNFVADKNIYKILFVGCEWYTKPYIKYFKNKEYWTIEIDPNKRKYGNPNRHIVDALQNLDKHITTNYFDLILCNGVFGWGINNQADTEIAIEQCYTCLRKGGILVLGWDDVDSNRPFFASEDCDSLNKFKPYFFAPLSTSEFSIVDSPTKHIFSFYNKM